jgi:hypothetical protein
LNIENEEITYVAWAYLNSTNASTHPAIIGESDLSDGYAWMGYNGRPGFRLEWGKNGTNSNYVGISDGSAYYNGWHLFVGVLSYPNNFAKLYVDGNEVASKTTGSFEFKINDATRIGFSYGVHYWKGFIDEVIIYNRALSKEEIKMLYETGSKEYSSVSLHSIGDWIDYTIEEPKKLEISNDGQMWNLKIGLNKTTNISFFNVNVSIPISLQVEPTSLNCSKNLTNLIFSDSYLSFIIPRLDKNEIYEITFSAKKTVETKSSQEKSSLKTGMIVNPINNFLSSPILGYIIIIDLVCGIVITSYFVHRRDKNGNQGNS